MAAHLQLLLDSDQAAGLGFAQGSKLLAYNRSPAKAAELAAEVGSAQAESPADLAVCSITFSMLANDAAVEAVLSSFLQGRQAAGDRAPPAALFIDCSTVLPSTTRRLAARAAAHGVGFVACPVFGRPDAAAAAQLIGIVAGGSAEQRERVKALVGAAFAGRGWGWGPAAGGAGAAFGAACALADVLLWGRLHSVVLCSALFCRAASD